MLKKKKPKPKPKFHPGKGRPIDPQNALSEER
jgi:hypothetical protein